MGFVEIDVYDGDPLGRYTLSNHFYMMTTEVTQGMFSAVMTQLAMGWGIIIPPLDASSVLSE